MIDLYSIKDVAQLFGLREARLRYWLQTGFIWPSVRRGGRFFYTFQDLISVKTAVELLHAGISVQEVRKALEALRAEIPEGVDPASRLRVASDGKTLVVVDDDGTYEPASGQLVMTFAVSSLGDQVAELSGTRGAGRSRQSAIPQAAGADRTEPHCQTSAYQFFRDGCEAEDRGDFEAAESLYQRAIELEPSMAAAHTNLGNLRFRRGQRDQAREHYQRALECDPDQAEARFNLGNLLDELGETDVAIAELRRVCHQNPDFADAHYNLGVILARVGGIAQARQHFERYLALDPDSEWAERARELARP